LVTEVRKRLSREWVRDPRISVSEIAFLLGYSDLRAFRRAYKTWFGQPPRGSAPAR
jgi:AraC-like DNA-binding protein